MFKLDLENGEEPEITLSTSTGSKKKQESSRKTSTFALLTTPIYIKAIYYQPAYLTYIRSITCRKNISKTSDMQMTPPLWQKEKRNKEPLDEDERGV